MLIPSTVGCDPADFEQRAGLYPRMHWAEGRKHPGQAAGPLQI